jgi:ribonuclease BN (tRNA processing enzyme)
MKVTTIGSGTGAPSALRVSSAHMIEAGGLRLLLDCGSGSVHRMAGLGLNWMEITHCLVSHFHADHISDIPTLIYAWRYGTLPWRTAPVQLIGPPGFRAIFDAMDKVYGSELTTLGFAVGVVELEPGSAMDLGNGVTVECHKVKHSAESVGYAIAHRNRRVVYTGDTPFDPGMAAWAGGCDLLLTECSLPSSMAVASHMTPEECAALAALVQPRALALTHFYAPLDGVDVAAIVESTYKGPVHKTFDGWTTELGD